MNEVLLTFKVEKKIEAIKIVRHLTSWGLYEAKEAVEKGMIFDSAYQIANFMQKFRAAYNGDMDFDLVPYKKSGPQNAVCMTFTW